MYWATPFLNVELKRREQSACLARWPDWCRHPTSSAIGHSSACASAVAPRRTQLRATLSRRSLTLTWTPPTTPRPRAPTAPPPCRAQAAWACGSPHLQPILTEMGAIYRRLTAPPLPTELFKLVRASFAPDWGLIVHASLHIYPLPLVICTICLPLFSLSHRPHVERPRHRAEAVEKAAPKEVAHYAHSQHLFILLRWRLLPSQPKIWRKQQKGQWVWTLHG